MRIDIISLFPQIASSALGESMIGRAQERGIVRIHSHNLRDWAFDKHRTTDDTPYGGGQGMVLKCEPVFAAVEALRSPEARVIYLSPGGVPLRHALAARLAAEQTHLILLCGHYEGLDQRAIDLLVDEEVSIGDYVLTNGAIAAAVLADAVVRLIPGVLGDAASPIEDSFATGLLEWPQYTRPVEFQGRRVPEVLLSGNHAAILKWRKEMALQTTRLRRPDLFGTPPSGGPFPAGDQCRESDQTGGL